MKARQLSYLVLSILVLCLGWQSVSPAQSAKRTPQDREELRKQVIYLVLLDRFFNGKTSGVPLKV